MEAVALHIVTDAGPAGEPAPAPVPTAPPRMEVQPLGLVALAELVRYRPLQSISAETEARGLQRWAQALPAGQVEKIAGKVHVVPLALLPDNAGSVQTVRDFLFKATGRAVHELLGLPIPAPLREQIPTWPERKRERFYARCELIRLLVEHDQKYAGLARPERDRLFVLEYGEYARARGLKSSARSVREARRRIDAGIDPDGRGRPRLDGGHSEDEKCSPDAWGRFRVLYLDPRRRGIRLCWELIAAEAAREGWAWPSYDSIRRRIKRDLPAAIADYWRLGARRWEAKHQTYIERDRAAQYRPNECWVSDHTRFDFWILHRGRLVRPWLTAWQDMASGLIVSWAIMLQPNSDTILASFCDGVLKHGAPQRVVFDNGKDFRAKTVAGGRRKRFDKARVDSAMERLQIIVTWAEVYHGQSKPIERFFGTMGERFCKLLDTYCGNCPANRPETLNADLKAGKIVAPELPEILAGFEAFVELYNNRPSSAEGRAGRTPAEAFVVNPIAKRTAPREVLEELLLPVATCRVGRLGVQVRGLWYGQDELSLLRYHGREVRVRFNPLDAGFVTVLDQDGRRICEARNRRLRGTTHDDIRTAKRRKQAAVRLVKSAYPAQADRLASVTGLAVQIAAQRRAADAVIAQRVAAGAETSAPAARDVQLLPGAAEVAAAQQQRKRAAPRPPDKSGPDPWELLATPLVNKAAAAPKCQADLVREFGARDRRRVEGPTRGEVFAELNHRYESLERPERGAGLLGGGGAGQDASSDRNGGGIWDLYADELADGECPGPGGEQGAKHAS